MRWTDSRSLRATAIFRPTSAPRPRCSTRVLAESAKKIAAGKPISSVLDEGRVMITQAGFALDYLEARHAETLAPVASAKERPLRLLVAARIGKTRLIDNVAV